MDDIQAKIAQAKKAGYSDDDIASHLASDPSYSTKIKTAKESGYSSSDIVDHLSKDVNKSDARSPEDESILSKAGSVINTFSKGLNAGAVGVAGIPMDTMVNLANLGIAAYGSSGIPEKFGKLPPQTIDPSTVLGTSENMMPSLFKKDEKDNPYIYAAGNAIPAAIATKSASPGMTTAQAVKYGAASGVGSQAGSDVGQSVGGDTGATLGSLAGGFLAPAAGVAGSRAIGAAKDAAINTVSNIAKPVDVLASREAANLLSKNIERAGTNPQELAANAASRGDEGVLADTNKTMQSLLGVAGRANAKVAGDTGNLLFKRHAGQSKRLGDTLDDVTGSGITSQDAIDRMHSETKPVIQNLYAKAAEESKSFPDDGSGNRLPPQISEMINGRSDIAKAAADAKQTLINKQEGGQESTTFDLINATKQNMDDRISSLYRAGENNKARDLVILKNKFLNIADENIPSFKEARDVFAGKMQLEDAAKNGEIFNKMSLSEAKDYVDGLSQSERAMAILGWKKDAINRIANTATGSDASARIFGKNGDIEKMKLLLDSPEAYDNFVNAMKRESDFIATKREFQGSQTAERLGAKESNQINPTSAIDTIKNIVTAGAKSKNQKVNDAAYAKLGDILTKEGLTLSDLNDFLKNKTPEKADSLPFSQRLKNKSSQLSTISALATQTKQDKK